MDNSSPIYTEFLPISRADMEARGWDQLDFVVVGGDAYVDHPSFGTAIISRLLEAEGYKVGVLAQPRYTDCEDFKRFGRPKYGFFIGGGNVAMDVTRSSIRLGASKVTCVYRRRLEDMTALPDEVAGATAEGAEMMTLAAPVRIEADEDGVARALWVQPQIIGDVDSSGRPKPNKAALDQVRIPADIIVVAIGQGIEIQGFDQAGVPITRGGRLVAALSGQVNDMDNIFAGGDCVTGPATAIRAIAAGKVAAANIDEHLGFRHEIRVDVDIPAPRLNNRPPHGRINTTERQACERKCDFEDIECGLTEEGAVTEASRCLRCDHFGYGIFRGGRDIKW